MNIIGRRLFSTTSRAATTTTAAGKIKVECMFDIISPFSYLQFEHLCRLRKDWTKMDLHFQPVFGYSVVKDSDNLSSAVTCANKASYIVKDASRIASFHKIPFRFPNDFLEQLADFSNLGILRFLVALQTQSNPSQFESMIRSSFQEFFSDKGFVMKDHSRISQVALNAGLDESLTKKCLEESQSTKIKDVLKKESARAVQLGAFGVPSTFVYVSNDDPVLFWGSDRNEFIAALLAPQ